MHRGERLVEHHHREDARAHRHVRRSRGDRVRRHHAGAGIPLGRAQGRAGEQAPARVQQGSTLRGEPAGIAPRAQDLRQAIREPEPGQAIRDELVELGEHARVVATRGGVDREHARGIADTEHVAAGQAPVHVPGKGRERGDADDVRLVVEDGLVEVGDRPPKRNGMAEQRTELGGCRPGRGVAPGAEGHQQPIGLVEGEVAVHHRRDADRPVRRGADSVACLRLRDQVGVAALHSRPDVVERVRPHPVDVRVLPVVAAGRERRPVLRDEAGLDAGGPELDPEDGTAAGDEVVRHCASSPHRRPSNGLRTSYHLPAGHRRGNRVPIRTRRAARVSRAGSLRFLPVRRCPSMPVRLRTTPCWSARPSARNDAMSSATWPGASHVRLWPMSSAWSPSAGRGRRPYCFQRNEPPCCAAVRSASTSTSWSALQEERVLRAPQHQHGDRQRSSAPRRRSNAMIASVAPSHVASGRPAARVATSVVSRPGVSG